MDVQTLHSLPLRRDTSPANEVLVSLVVDDLLIERPGKRVAAGGSKSEPLSRNHLCDAPPQCGQRRRSFMRGGTRRGVQLKDRCVKLSLDGPRQVVRLCSGTDALYAWEQVERRRIDDHQLFLDPHRERGVLPECARRRRQLARIPCTGRPAAIHA